MQLPYLTVNLQLFSIPIRPAKTIFNPWGIFQISTEFALTSDFFIHRLLLLLIYS